MSDGGLRRKRRDQLYELEGNKRVQFQEALEEESAKDITEVSSDEFEDQEEPRNSGDSSGSDIVEIKQLQHNGRKTRSFASIPHKLQGLCYLAQTFITDYTFFKLPFLSALDIINLVNEAWDWAQEHEKSYLKRTKACEAFISKNFLALQYNFVLCALPALPTLSCADPPYVRY
ncbi:hypothetical protein L211DRAFT_853566 [Terfezia boudieri ATCC MYA-4762]|uniref:Uncharacterized protein n=1 Tax=Terfezia boudieri ATCC MYA-4762 TaxID=1051890 RepID=A0A3N4LM48_9PEZI|nr:hypothetical protein L211DRAFT_853566 [Terfezia boudieri ATCC MYA-4762]